MIFDCEIQIPIKTIEYRSRRAWTQICPQTVMKSDNSIFFLHFSPHFACESKKTKLERNRYLTACLFSRKLQNIGLKMTRQTKRTIKKSIDIGSTREKNWNAKPLFAIVIIQKMHDKWLTLKSLEFALAPIVRARDQFYLHL